MGKIRKQGDKWVVDFRLPRHIARKYGVSRFRRVYSKKSIASKVHGQVASAIALNDPDGIIGKLLGGGSEEYTVKTFYDRWIIEYCQPRLEASTLKLYRLNVKTLNEFFGGTPLKEFRRQHLHGYIQKRSTEVTPTTVNKDIIACKRMFSYAAEVGVIESNPLVRFPTLRVQEKALRIPTVDEFRLLVEAISDPALAAMVAIMGECGLRRSEAINLEWKNVNLRQARITLEKTKGKRVRNVPLSEYAVSCLRSITRFIHQPRVFCHQVSGEPWLSPDKAFRAARAKAKLDWITMHTLRHMRGTRWIENGADIMSVKDGLGHASIQTTQRYTKHVQYEKALREAQEAEKAAGRKRDDKDNAK